MRNEMTIVMTTCLCTYALSRFGAFNVRDTADGFGGTFGGGFDVFEGRREGALDGEELESESEAESESESESESEADDEAEELSSEDSSDDEDDADEEDEESDIARTGAVLGSTGLAVLVAADSFAFFRGGGPGDRDRRAGSGEVLEVITCCILHQVRSVSSQSIAVKGTAPHQIKSPSLSTSTPLESSSSKSSMSKMISSGRTGAS